MNLKSRLAAQRSVAKVAVSLTALIGALCLIVYPKSGPLRGLSFDLPFLFTPDAKLDGIVIIKMDNDAHRALKQEHGRRWDRTIHANLLKRLKADDARLVVFDVFLADPASTTNGQIAEEDRVFIEAIRDFKNVILAKVPRPFSRQDFALPAGYKPEDPIPPAEIFLSAVENRYGLGAVFKDYDSVLRQHRPLSQR